MVELERQVEEATQQKERHVLLDYIAWANDKIAWLDPLVRRRDPFLGEREAVPPIILT